ncbi:RNB-domain-containing protein [Fomitiporia mediterranea MF3/22]|uniref:RNB-domain-containing protein n=1 Tax=Fomitiporia mediterranea (strain MF3/22) TaxID=694068 RepID=UPI0004407D83|nr:RNB-domain-containing protein [Fomitiporia mediterranea MF3/22]EJD04318.1 RNB-domain-containing protein [Fomitiporia mediterranea MF3/22]
MLSSSLRRAHSKSTDVSVRQIRRATSAVLTKSKPKPRPYKVDESDLRRIRGTAKELVEGANQAYNPEWRHTYKREGERKRYEQDLSRKKDPLQHDGRGEPNIFSGHPLEDWSMEDLVQSGTGALQPGTYFELRRNAESMNGVVLGATNNIGYHQDTVSITTRGEVIVHRTTDIMFAVPNFVDSNLAERCGTQELHEDEFQLAARIRILKAARDFERAVEKEQYRLGRAIQDIYHQVRAQHPDEWTKVSTMQVARMLDATPNVPIVTLFAVHRQLMERADEFVCHPTRHRFVHEFDVRPLSDLKNIEKVKQMVRERSPMINAFQQKARLLIDQSRALAAQSTEEPPAVAEVVKRKFTPQDQEIITFLKLSMIQGRLIQQDSYAGNVPAIIKDTYRYEELITSYTTLKFLREIGVFTPWEDLASREKGLHIPIGVEEKTASTTKASSSLPKSQAQTPGLLTTDAHENVRHDFGDMPVYVIDDAHAEELDDGISVERVVGDPNSVWIHVHVADPTSVIPFTHPLRQQVEKRSETYYFGHRTIPMLPADIGKLCDMGREGVRTSGQNVLTFSAKVGKKGDILDYKVRAGRVRNVHKLRYGDVDSVVDPGALAVEFTPFEPEASESSGTVDTSYLRQHEENLKLVFEVTRRTVAERLARNAFTFCLNSPQVTFPDKPVPQAPPHVTQPILYRGYPRLRYTVIRGEVSEIGSRSLVAECMKLAGRVASRFCLEHNIPGIRRAMASAELEETTLSRVLAERDPLGFISPSVLAREGIGLPPGELTSEPAGHWILGIPDGEGYIRTTSPLRRSDDLFMHWQIKSALLPGKESHPPPINDEKMKDMVDILNVRKQVLKRAYRAHTRQWAHTYIERYMDSLARSSKSKSNHMHNPLKGMDATVVIAPIYNLVRWMHYQEVYIPMLGLIAVMPIKTGSDIPLGAHIKVDAKNIFQYDLNRTLEVSLAS